MKLYGKHLYKYLEDQRDAVYKEHTELMTSGTQRTLQINNDDSFVVKSPSTTEGTFEKSNELLNSIEHIAVKLSDMNRTEVPAHHDFSRFTKVIEEPRQLTDTPFYVGALNLVYGLSKVGKTQTVLKILGDAGYTTDKFSRVLWLDKDYNIAITPPEGTIHLNFDIDEAYDELIKMDLKNYILVVDSLKDFAEGDLDQNDTSQKAMEKIRRLNVCGATVILIAHATSKSNQQGEVIGIKVKGNEETIFSKCDVSLKMTKVHSGKHNITIRKFECERSRFGDTDAFEVFDETSIAKAVRDVVNSSNEDITKNELARKFDSRMRSAVYHQDGISFYTERIKGKSKPSYIVRLIEALDDQTL